ncbi:hypothetical protein TWF694_003164 [Orbilia ellipsospora]|uniref:Uncharacterized protein n=1 Tax=Orbilia ellipsospora TaxID=2528407 RepID=A0AAV9X1Z3_9PEZI
MRSKVAPSVLYKLYVACSHLFHTNAFEIQQRDLVTTTVYETVFDGDNVTYVLTCDSPSSPLPKCNQVTWRGLGLSTTANSTTSPASTSPPSSLSSPPSTTSSSPAASSSFVLQGSGEYANFFFEFNTANNRVLLGALGQQTLVSLQLDNSVLRNSANTSQIVYLQYNTTIAQDFASAGESDSIVSQIREVRFGASDDIIETDYADGWFWNASTNQPGLIRQNAVWSFFAQVGKGSEPGR